MADLSFSNIFYDNLPEEEEDNSVVAFPDAPIRKESDQATASSLQNIYYDNEDDGKYPSLDGKNLFDNPNNINPTDKSLRKEDLKSGKNVRDIRALMISRFGQDYRGAGNKTDDDVVEDFIGHMRWVEANVVKTAGEVRWISNASDDEKMLAQRAYSLYDQMGNVFVNDGYYGAFDGMKDYIFAVAADPTSWVGLLTGGLAKGGAVGSSVAGKALIKKAMAEASERVIKNKGTKQAAKQAGNKAKENMLRKMSTEINAKKKKAVGRSIFKANQQAFLQRSALEAQEKLAKDISKQGATKALNLSKKEAGSLTLRDRAFGGGTTLGISKPVFQTGVLDATAAVLQDAAIQSNRIDIGVQDEFSAISSAFSSLAGFASVGAHVGFKKMGAEKSGLENSKDRFRINQMVSQANLKATSLLNKTQSLKAADHIIQKTKGWRTKVKEGTRMMQSGQEMVTSDYVEQPLVATFLRDVILGTGGKGQTDGLLRMYIDDFNIKLTSKVNTSDLITDIIPEMTDIQLRQLNDLLADTGMGLKFGDLTQIRVELPSLMAAKFSEAGQILSVASVARRVLDGAILKGDEALEAMKRGIELKDEAAGQKSRTKYASFAQNAWKRLLVSSPATTFVNVQGFAQFFGARSIAEMLNGGVTYAYGSITGNKEMQRMGAVYGSMVIQKLKNLGDPYSTRQAYEEFLLYNEDVQKTLKATITAGVDRKLSAFNMPQEGIGGKIARGVENTVTTANRVTAVELQDSVTKALMLTTEMDKLLRLKHGVTLSDVINAREVSVNGKLVRADVDLIDTDIVGSAVDTTLRSVFAKDYTTDDQGLKGLAELVEKISATPGLGTILPFGRFFNSVVATTYQWSLGGLVQYAKTIGRVATVGEKADVSGFGMFKGIRFKRGQEAIEPKEALYRSVVGLTAISLAMQSDDEAKAKNLPWYQREVNGAVVDFKNTFPMSVWMIAGRISNTVKDGDTVSNSLLIDLGDALAVGQVARDTQFSNDLLNMMDVMFNDEPDKRQINAQQVYRAAGNIAAGFTRPLDALNKIVGYMADSDVAKDARQETGANVFAISATKYVDNLIEIFLDKDVKIGALGTKTLRVGGRAGDIQDPNPIARAIGVTTKPGRTSTEILYSMAEMKDFKSSERSNLPAYDRVFNELFAPIMERASAKWLDTGVFQNGTQKQKEQIVKNVKNETANTVRKLMDENYRGNDAAQLSLKRKAKMQKKDAKEAAFKYLKSIGNGYEGSISDMNTGTLMRFLDYIEMYEDNRL
tara:strand:- start:176 stop:3967 length:3792 start_codon:yes stop_codon:yes gene_type:complete